MSWYLVRDKETLSNLSEREAQIAAAATRLAYDKVGEWLSDKQTKAEQFPGSDPVHAAGRAAAYCNAAQTIFLWALRHPESE